MANPNNSLTVTRSVLITKEQEKWIEDNDLNLSSFVRKQLDKRIAKAGEDE